MNWRKLPAKRNYLFLWLLLAMVGWFTREMIWGARVPFFRDLGTYFYPMRFSLAESFKAGELPLWDRHIAMGFPLLADFQSGAFYPPHLFYLVFSFFTAIKATFLFHYLVAALGSYLLCRQWRYPPYLAITGATLFTLGGTIVSLTNLLNHFQTAVWLPWVLFFGERVLRSASWKDFLALTLVLLLQFLAGSPELYAMSMGLLFLDGLRLKVAVRNVECCRIFFLLLAANFLVAGLAMVQILPTVELFLESWRHKSFPYGSGPAYSLQPLSLINLFFVDKQLEIDYLTAPQLFFVPNLPFLISHYMGAISLVGSSLWLFYASRIEKGVLSGVIGICLVIAMGDRTSVYSFFFHYVPFFSLLRFPEKFFFITYALLLFIVLKGLFRFLHSGDSSRRPLLIVSSICFLFFFLYLFLRMNTEPLSRFIAWTTHTPILTASTIGKSSSVLVNLEKQMALTFGILLLFFFRKKDKIREPLFKALLVAIVFVDLNSAHQPYQYLLNPDLVYKSPRVIVSPDPQPDRFFYYPSPSNLHPSYYSFPKEPSFAKFNSLVFSNLLPNTGVFNGFDYMQELDALGRWPYTLFLNFANKVPSERQYRLLGVLNVSYLISFRPLPEEGITLVRHFPEHPSWLYKIDRVIPRAYIVPGVMVEKDPLKVLDQLSSAELDPLKEVILEQPLSLTPKEGFQGQAELVRYKNQEVAIRASLNGFGILVLADSFYPGWRVYVDGQDKEILRANLFFRAVPLSPGEHLVEFRYEPRSFRIGLIISLITLSGVVIGSILLRFVNQNKRHTGKLY